MLEMVPDKGTGHVMGVPVQGLLPVDGYQDSDLRLYRMVLPFLPPSKNVYDNWPGTWRSSAKRKWKNWIEREVAAQMIPKAETIGLAAVLVFPQSAQRDPQNYSNCLWHWVPDALQSAGVIDGDHEGKIQIGPNWGLKMMVDPRKELSKERRKRTHLALTMRVAKGE